MGCRVSLAAMLLIASASLVSFQLPSSAALRAPKIGSYSYASPASSQLFKKKLKDFLGKSGSDVVDIAQKFLPPPAPSPGAQPAPPGAQLDNAPAKTAGLYTVDLLVGTPARPISGVMDISSQLVWTQCHDTDATTSSTFSGPLNCGTQTCQNSFIPSPTCTSADDLCGYSATYGENIFTYGYLVSDTFTFDKTQVPDMLFGCNVSSTGFYSGASGVIGLGRGKLSLVTQLAVSNFSYFLAPDDSDGINEIQLGDVAVPQMAGHRIRSTRLQSSNMYTEFYYVNLTGIQVDGQDLAIPRGTFDLRADGTGGVFMSTTVPVTYLLEDAYNVLRQAFVNKMMPSNPVDASELGLDLCYTAQSMSNVPRLTLVFDGEDAAMHLRVANYIFEFKDSNLKCLTILPSLGASLLGSLLQTNKTMIYDLDGEQLMFVEDAQSSPSQTPLSSQAQPLQIARLAVIVPVAILSLLFQTRVVSDA